MICTYHMGNELIPVMDAAVIVQGLGWPDQEGGWSLAVPEVDTNLSSGRQYTMVYHKS